jgi:hypothetical protein
METITRYGDVGPPERHLKFGGVEIKVVEGQELAFAPVTDYLDAFLAAKFFNQEQYNAVYLLIRDYQIGSLYKWKIVKEYLRSQGLSDEDADREREEARRNFNVVIRYNHEFVKLANIAHLVIGSIGVYIPPIWKLQQLSDRLVTFYKNNERIKLEEAYDN